MGQQWRSNLMDLQHQLHVHVQHLDKCSFTCNPVGRCDNVAVSNFDILGRRLPLHMISVMAQQRQLITVAVFGIFPNLAREYDLYEKYSEFFQKLVGTENKFCESYNLSSFESVVFSIRVDRHILSYFNGLNTRMALCSHKKKDISKNIYL